MTHRSKAGALAVGVVWLALAESGYAQTAAPGSRVTATFDWRGRFESDLSSTHEDGTPRPDRHRGRVRARVEVHARAARSLFVIGRVRTGSPFSQQSPHLTLFDWSGGRRDSLQAVADKYLVHHTTGRFETWAGRNEFPFWTQNELFWDRDVTLPGGSVSYTTPFARPSLQVRAGYFGLPDGAVEVRGRMRAGQVVSGVRLSDIMSIQGALGLFDMQGAAVTKHLLADTGASDYRIVLGSVQLTRTVAHGWVRSLRIGADLLRNVRSYAASPDPGVAAFRNARTGVAVTTIVAGRSSSAQPNAWEIGHTYAHLEKLAVNASYAQDDWVRWGSATQTRASNLRGNEVSGRYWLTRNVDVHARGFLARSLSTPQNGVRLRVDVNWRFSISP